MKKIRKWISDRIDKLGLIGQSMIGGGVLTLGVLIILNWLVIIPIVISNYQHPLSRFDLPKRTITKVHFTDGTIRDSIVKVTIKDNVMYIKHGKKIKEYPNLKYQYWYVDGEVNTLTWENPGYIIQYKSIGFNKPHSIDMFKIGKKGRTHEQFVF